MRSVPRAALVLSLAWWVASCGSSTGEPSRPVAILSAFPAELAAVLAHTTVEDTTDLDGRPVRHGHLAGVPVLVAMTGIGLVNAARTTAALLDAFPVRGVIVAGVAGSPYRIGDVAVPAAWAGADGEAIAVEPRWLAVAERLSDLSPAFLARCGRVPTHGDAEVCLGFAPAVVVGGRGESSDPFGDQPFVCMPDAHPVFGCDIPATLRRTARGLTVEPVAVDMETAAIAREAQRRGLPFIAFRAVSDGAEDPLDLPGFPAQFFAYYPLAAHNAAAATAAFVARLGGRAD